VINDFDKAFAIVIGVEGGYESPAQALANKDPGGETKFGIAKAAHPDLDIANLTIDQAKAIYQAQYWVPIKGDLLPCPLSIFMFDCAVNQGAGTAIMLLQKTIGVAQDGILGVGTMSTLAKSDPSYTASRFMANRGLRYTGTRNFDINGLGWMSRLFSVTMEALK
jgi:lysozyme family protein